MDSTGPPPPSTRFSKTLFNLCDKKKQFSTFNGQVTRKLCWAYLGLKNIQNVACGKCHLPQWQQWLKVLKTKERKKAPKKLNTEGIIKEDNADPLFNSNTAPNVFRCVKRNGDTCSCETHCFTITMCVIKSTHPKSISISLILWLLGSWRLCHAQINLRHAQSGPAFTDSSPPQHPRVYLSFLKKKNKNSCNYWMLWWI